MCVCVCVCVCIDQLLHWLASFAQSEESVRVLYICMYVCNSTFLFLPLVIIIKLKYMFPGRVNNNNNRNEA